MSEREYPAGSENPQNPVDELKQLKTELQGAEAEVNKQNRKKEALKGDITALEGVANEVKNVVNAYSQAFKNLKCEKEDLDDYIAKNESRITDAVKDKKEKIDSSIKRVEDPIQEASNQLKNLLGNYQAANDAYEKATKEVKAQAAYDSQKGYQKNLQDYLNELKALRDSIEKGNDKSDVAKYFFMREMKRVKDQPGAIVRSPDWLQEALYGKWDDLKGEKDQLREKKEARDNAKEFLEAAQKNLEALEKARWETILAAIKSA